MSKSIKEAPPAPLVWRVVFSLYEAFLLVFAICCVYGLMLEFIPKRQVHYASYAACESAIVQSRNDFNKAGKLDYISDTEMNERIQKDCEPLR